MTGSDERQVAIPQGCRGVPGGSAVKNLPVSIGEAGDPGSIPGLGISWRRKWQPTPVFLLEKSYGQRSLAGYSQ